MSKGSGGDRALLVAMPLRHLESAAERCLRDGWVVLPAGGPGGLDDARSSERVLLIATDAGVEQVPAATWAAAYEGRVHYQEGDPWPAGLPPTWVDEHPTYAAVARDPSQTDEDDDEEIVPDRIGPQAFFQVGSLAPLQRAEWVFANEVISKQRRDGRTFVPRVPTIVSLPA